MKRKLSLVIMIMIFLSVFLFASGEQEGTTAGTGEKTIIQEYKPDFVFPTEKTELTYWTYFDERPARTELEKQISKEYTAIHPNVTIDVIGIPWVGYETKYEAAFMAGTQPDIIIWQPGTTTAKGYTDPAPDWARKWFDDNYSEAGIKKMEFAGEYWGMPGNSDVGQMLYYNKDMYEEAGVAVPETMPEFVEVMKKTTKYDAAGDITQGGYGIRYFGQRGGITDKWRAFAYAWVDGTKGFAYNEDLTDVVFDSPAHVEALEFFRKMVFEWKVSSTTMPKPSDAFKFGLVAATYRESWMYADLDQTAPDVNYGIAPMMNGAAPYGEFVVGAGFNASHVVMVSTPKEELQDLAWDFVLHLTNPENDLRMAAIQGSLPVVEANMGSDYVKNLPYGETAQVVMLERPFILSQSHPAGIDAEINSFIGEAVELVLTGQLQPKEALDIAAKKAREVMAKAK